MMTGNIDVQSTGQEALNGTNKIFESNDYNFRVQMLTAADMDWCIAMQRDQPLHYRLPWNLAGGALDDPDAFSFSFKILDAVQRPAGACICHFCPATFEAPAILDVEMIQNFHIQDSLLDGNTLRFALYVLILFMADTQCTGLRLLSPVNETVADYYLQEHQFSDLTGGLKEVLYRDAADLYEWFKADTTQVDDE